MYNTFKLVDVIGGCFKLGSRQDYCVVVERDGRGERETKGASEKVNRG